jgi:tetratricopeptide (TPR) repeat protein
VYQAYSEAEQLVNEPNHAGLEQAIEKYQQALDLDGHFALGYAELAIAYLRQFYLTRESANLDLAIKQCGQRSALQPSFRDGSAEPGAGPGFAGQSG